jgi:hypothetical protein
VSALDAETRRDLSGSGVACCLRTLLQASNAAAAGTLAILPGGPALLTVSQVLREQAEREIASAGYASRFADIALNALGTATFEAASSGSSSVFDVSAEQVIASLSGYTNEHRLHDLSLCFVAHDFDHLFRHLVSRDTPDFVGSQGMPTIAHASQLRDAVAAYCRESVARVEAAGYEDRLAEALQAGPAQGQQTIEAVLTDLTELSLQRLAVEG